MSLFRKGLAILLCLLPLSESIAQVVINEIGAAGSDSLQRSHPDGRPRLGWGPSWCEFAFDDAAWEVGTAPFGFGVEGVATDLGEEMRGRTPSVYLRKIFTVSAGDAALAVPFRLTARADSGFVAYVNGHEIARANLGRRHGFVYHDQSAFSSAQSDEMLDYESAVLANDVLQPGENVFAVQMQNTVPSQINERDQTIDESLKFEATLAIGEGAAIEIGDEDWKYRVGYAEPSGGVVDWTQAASSEVEGDFSDWIELHNTGADAVDLTGWHLTDDSDEPGLWAFPDNTAIPASGYLLILADGNTEVSGDYLHTSFGLSADGEFLGLSDTSGDYVSQFEDDFPKQFPFQSYGLNAAGDYIFMESPTPGAPNAGVESSGAVKKPKFDPTGGVYDETVLLTLTSNTEAAVIRYTLDGSEPTEINGMLYEGPMSIEAIDDRTGTPVRARAYKGGMIPSVDNTQTYLVSVDEAFKSIPTLSLVADSGDAFYKPHGIMSVEGSAIPRSVTEYYMPAMHGRPFERKISMEVIYPDDGTNVQMGGGLRLSASAFSRFNFSLGRTDASPWPSEAPQKPSFNLFLRRDYGDDTLNFPLVENYPVRQFRQFRLRAGKNDIVNPFIVDELARRIFTDTGQFGAVGIQHALFVNGSYKGYYNMVARLREPLLQDLYGSEAPWQVKHIDVWADGSPFEDKLKDTPEWEHLETLLKKDLRVLENYEAVTAELDPISFADYFIVNLYGATEDWPNNNLIIARELSDVGRWRAYIWDAEVCFGVMSSHSLTHDSIVSELSQLDRTPSNDLATVWSRLIRSPEWRLVFADRLQKHFFTPGGALTKANLTRRTNELADEIAPLMAFAGPDIDTSEIAEWIDQREDALFAGGIWERHLLWGELPIPSFSPAGGSIEPNTPIEIALETPVARTRIYYTTDGSDPRLPGGDLNSEAILADPEVAITLDTTTTIRARVQQRTVFDSTWGALREVTYRVGLEPAGTSNLLISELMVDPEGASEAEKAADFSTSNFEYIEFYNPTDVAIDLADLRFTAGINYVFNDGDRSTLGPKSFGVIVNDRAAFAQRYGDGLPILGEFNKKLSNGGELLEISNSRFETIVSLSYSDDAPWPANVDDEGKSLVFASLMADKDPNDPAGWVLSNLKGGTPGRAVGEEPPDQDLLEAVQLATDGFTLKVTGETLVVTLTRKTEASVLYTLEFSNDLQAWRGTAETALVGLDSQPAGEGLTTETYESPMPQGAGQSYARWRVDSAP